MSESSAREFDVIIVGAGIIGAAMACLLLRQRSGPSLRVALLADRFARTPPADADWDLRVYALSRASERLLRLCGIWDTLPAARVMPYERMHVWDAKVAPRGPGSLSFDCADIGEPNLGYIVDGQVLQWLALQRARALGAVLIEAPLHALAAAAHGARAGLEDGRELRGTLIVGADGTESKTRQLLGIETAGHAYHQEALVTHVRTAAPHQNSAWQRFLPTGPLAMLPLPDGRCSIVWSMSRDEATRLRALDPEAFGAALTAASGEVLGSCTVAAPLAAFALKLQYAAAYARPHAVLLGDAAHVVHPLAGQGLNLGLLDCAALAQVLEESGSPRGFGDMRVLRRYERWRRSENLLAGAGLDAIERLFSSTSLPVAAARRFGLGAVQRSPILKRRLAQQALGLSGDVPAIIAGVAPARRAPPTTRP
jgi:2-octaprenylphenol hydroxylase